jgi:hypothetical protein
MQIDDTTSKETRKPYNPDAAIAEAVSRLTPAEASHYDVLLLQGKDPVEALRIIGEGEIDDRRTATGLGAAMHHANARRHCEKRALEASSEARKLEQIIEQVKENLMLEVAGDPAFSNDAKRKSEVNRRFVAEGHHNTVAQIGDLQHEATSAAIDAKYHRDMVNILTAFAGRED